jgi:mono/diheme cytochrome c family protein
MDRTRSVRHWRPVKTIIDGVPNPKDYRSPMPPKGGAQLSGSDVSAVAAYVWALGHQAAR